MKLSNLVKKQLLSKNKIKSKMTNSNKIRSYNTHPFHLVDVSPWPILMSISFLSGALAIVDWLTIGANNGSVNLIL